MKVIKIGAEWCLECVIMKPRWDQVENKLTWLETEFIDLDKQPQVKKDYQINHVPTFIFLDKNGNEFNRMKGLVEEDDLVDFLEQNKDK